MSCNINTTIIIEITVFQMKEAVAALPKYDVIIEQVNLGPFRFFHLDFLDSLWVFPK